jgi:hypothetical protein
MSWPKEHGITLPSITLGDVLTKDHPIVVTFLILETSDP